MNSNDQEKITLRNKIIVDYQNYLREFINQNSESPSLIMLLGEIQNPVEFKDELLLIKDVIIKKFENQKYLGLKLIKAMKMLSNKKNSWRSKKQGTNKTKNN